MPMTPQADLAPAFPVDLLSSWPPLPRSSTSACTTMVRPMMDFSPVNEIMESDMLILAVPPVASTLPRSPACLSPWGSVGAPCEQPSGLKWGPALTHPLVLSPNLKKHHVNFFKLISGSTYLVNMEAVQAISQTRQLTSENNRAIPLLLEVNSSSDGAVTLENTHSLYHCEYLIWRLRRYEHSSLQQRRN